MLDETRVSVATDGGQTVLARTGEGGTVRAARNNKDRSAEPRAMAACRIPVDVTAYVPALYADALLSHVRGKSLVVGKHCKLARHFLSAAWGPGVRRTRTVPPVYWTMSNYT